MRLETLPPYLRGQIADALLDVGLEVAERLGYHSGDLDGVRIPTEADIVLALRQPIRAALILARVAELLGVEPPPEVLRACTDLAGGDAWRTDPDAPGR
ncbi:MAG: hypothetical protein QJR07_09290 [Acetobacteraceae bacterium]|nr:hypothetical protein [Acetobacteraceae bacterium]MDI3307285.1 hypothetical protein [Acetobacteraceae bacterium]